MHCPSCNVENKEEAKNCKKCGFVLEVIPMWSPTWKWHAKTLGIIYVILTVVYFALSSFLKPYLRQIPPEVTPWLQSHDKMHK